MRRSVVPLLSVNNKWEVSIDYFDDHVHIYPSKGLIILSGNYGSPWPYMREYVHKPGYFERLFKITFKDKVKRSIKYFQDWCDKENEKDEKNKVILAEVGTEIEYDL